MHTYLSPELRIPFDGVRLYRCCNKRSVMFLRQCNAYCCEFRLKGAMYRAARTILQGIGGKRMPIGTTKIQVPFTGLRIIIDVAFLILSEDVPTLFSMIYMVLKR